MIGLTPFNVSVRNNVNFSNVKIVKVIEIKKEENKTVRDNL